MQVFRDRIILSFRRFVLHLPGNEVGLKGVLFALADPLGIMCL